MTFPGQAILAFGRRRWSDSSRGERCLGSDGQSDRVLAKPGIMALAAFSRLSHPDDGDGPPPCERHLGLFDLLCGDVPKVDQGVLDGQPDKYTNRTRRRRILSTRPGGPDPNESLRRTTAHMRRGRIVPAKLDGKRADPHLELPVRQGN